MKRLICALALAVTLAAGVLPAAASCTYHTYFINGQMYTCTTCCWGGSSCTTTCY